MHKTNNVGEYPNTWKLQATATYNCTQQRGSMAHVTYVWTQTCMTSKAHANHIMDFTMNTHMHFMQPIVSLILQLVSDHISTVLAHMSQLSTLVARPNPIGNAANREFNMSVDETMYYAIRMPNT